MMKIVHLAYKPTLLGDENVKLHADIDDFETGTRRVNNEKAPIHMRP